MNWDDHAEAWDRREGVRAYARAAYGSLVRRASKLDFRLDAVRACDFGCGTGLLSEKLAETCAEVVAIDSSRQMIEALQAKIVERGHSRIRPLCITLKTETIAASPELAEPFDIVVCSSVCAFLEDYPNSVALLRGLLHPGGLFVQWDWELNPADEEPWGLSRESICDALQGAGLELLSLDSEFTIDVGGVAMSPLMAVGRLPEAARSLQS